MKWGGHSALKTDEEGLATISSYKDIIEEFLGTTYEYFEPFAYTTQVVAGTVFQAKIRVDGGDVIHVKIARPLPHTDKSPHVMKAETGKTEDDGFHFS